MTIKLDLFKLHDPKKDARSRGWITLGGKEVIKETRNILLRLLRRNSIRGLAKQMSNGLNVKSITIENYLYELKNNRKNKEFIPIAIIQGLLRIYSPTKYDKIKWKIINLTDEIGCNAPRSKLINNPKILTDDIVLLSGIHAADGTLNNHKTGKGRLYRITIIDADKESLNKVKEIVKRTFNFNIKIRKSIHENAYLIIIDNKPIIRIFNKLLNFKIGYKITSVRMPKIIKRLNLKKQKLFIKGFLTFDGSVDIAGYLRLSIKNKSLIKEIINILKSDGINVKLEHEKTRPGVGSFRVLIPKDPKFLGYLIKDTMKYKRAKFFIVGKTSDNIFTLFNEKPHNKTSIHKMLNLTKNLEMFTISKIRDLSKLSDRTLRSYLRVLIIAGFIKEVKKKSNFDTKIKSIRGFDELTAITLNNNFRNKLFEKMFELGIVETQRIALLLGVQLVHE